MEIQAILIQRNKIEYWKFIRQFEYYVESKVSDPGQRLLYVMHYCQGRSRKAIDSCIILPPNVGYQRACAILREVFGLPHVGARSMIDDVLREAKMVQDSAESLSRSSLQMENCLITLQQMQYESDLNCMWTIECIIKCPPSALQGKWAEVADRILTDGHDPRFAELTTFISERARISRSRFGQLAECSSSTHNARFGRNQPRLSNHSITAKNEGASQSCVLCTRQHDLGTSPQFLYFSVDERWNFARRKGLCYQCLRKFYRNQPCSLPIGCAAASCQGSHHTLLHRDQVKSNEDGSVRPLHCNAMKLEGKALRGTIAVKIQTPSGLIDAIALLDSGSDTALILERFVNQHELDSSHVDTVLTTLNSRRKLKSKKVSFTIFSADGTETIDIDEAFAVDSLSVVSETLLNDLLERYPHLTEVQLPPVTGGIVTFLLECNVPEAHWVFEQRLDRRREPFASKTLLGWVLQGPTGPRNGNVISVKCTVTGDLSVQDNLQSLYDQEFHDLSDDRLHPSAEDRRALSIVSSTHLVAGKFEVPLPWRSDKPNLPNNLQLVLKRLSFLKRRLIMEPSLMTKYAAMMQHHIDSGHLEGVKSGVDPQGKTWYLPHHPVFNPAKPEKLRIVYDCAAECGCLSLNKCLLSGPNMTQNIVEVLLRFRKYPVVVAADIEEMFLKVNVPQQDRDALRVLWWAHNDLNAAIKTYRMTVYPFGATSSPFALHMP